ncbi:hypothetical protein [Amnibacterium endophyticum]|uniref:Glycosyltransferase RgtA/B/C/D-like domain-containing protein n=1 Tax=Amnibacterium endophyticum TaxID=2109337 RepID=A0ABW4LIL7_9MICO
MTALPLDRRRLRLPRREVLLLVAIGLVAFALRLQMAVRGGGLLGVGAYDDGVHYAAAASLLHGRLPYRDFLFLQPPGMVLAASPFAGIGGLLGDPVGLRAFRVAFQLVGAANAVLVALVVRRWGVPAMLVGGIGYAVFFPAVYDERTALLEPVGTTGILLALLLTRHGASHRAHLVAGLALGVACGFKIWYVVPALVVLAFAHGGRLRVLAGAVVAGLVVYLPFFAAAPATMWAQVVLAQAGRGRSDASGFLTRARTLLGAVGVHRHGALPGVDVRALTIVLLLLVVAGLVIAVLTPGARVIATMLVADWAVAQASPSFFAHYAGLTAPVLMLLLGVAVGRVVPLLKHRGAAAGAVTLTLVAVVALNARHDLERVDVRPPGAALQAAAARIPGCIASDDPTLLAVMDVLSRDLDEGCPLRPDTGGYSFGPERLEAAGGGLVGRRQNPGYQRSTTDYLLDSAAFIRWRRNTALNAESLDRLREQPVLAKHGIWTIRAGTR